MEALNRTSTVSKHRWRKDRCPNKRSSDWGSRTRHRACVRCLIKQWCFSPPRNLPLSLVQVATGQLEDKSSLAVVNEALHVWKLFVDDRIALGVVLGSIDSLAFKYDDVIRRAHVSVERLLVGCFPPHTTTTTTTTLPPF